MVLQCTFRLTAQISEQLRGPEVKTKLLVTSFKLVFAIEHVKVHLNCGTQSLPHCLIHCNSETGVKANLITILFVLRTFLSPPHIACGVFVAFDFVVNEAVVVDEVVFVVFNLFVYFVFVVVIAFINSTASGVRNVAMVRR